MGPGVEAEGAAERVDVLVGRRTTTAIVVSRAKVLVKIRGPSGNGCWTRCCRAVGPIGGGLGPWSVKGSQSIIEL